MSKENKKDTMNEKLGCGCCTDDSAILKAINNAQAGRIEALEKELLALKEQQQIDLGVKKDLDKRLDDLTADYRTLWVQHQNLKSVNDALLHKNNILNNAKVNLIETNRGLQSKVAKQSNEIKRLTDELQGRLAITNENLKKLAEQNKTLKDALEQASKDSENSFKRGRYKGLTELWASLQWAQDRLKRGDELFPVYGYHGMAACVDNLTATAFLRKSIDWQEKEARDIKIGDEVIVISPSGSDDSDYGIVYNITEQADGSKRYNLIGCDICIAFGDEAIAKGSVRKTGDYFDSIPFDYLA